MAEHQANGNKGHSVLVRCGFASWSYHRLILEVQSEASQTASTLRLSRANHQTKISLLDDQIRRVTADRDHPVVHSMMAHRAHICSNTSRECRITGRPTSRGKLEKRDQARENVGLDRSDKIYELTRRLSWWVRFAPDLHKDNVSEMPVKSSKMVQCQVPGH